MGTYGNLPDDLGLIDLNPVEMKFWMYCPVKMPGQFALSVPPSLEEFQPILDRVFTDIVRAKYESGVEKWTESYVYLTAKTLFVNSENPGNRPGWHSDGFRTTDLNYIWYDRAPTEFTDGRSQLMIFDDVPDGPEVLRDMERFGNNHGGKYFPNKHLLKLDQTVIHRVPAFVSAGMRTFVKASVSKDRYDLEGNSINPLFGPIFDMKKRNGSRNHPSSEHQ